MAVMGAWADIAVLSTPSESSTTLSDANGIVTITDASGSTGIQQGSGSYKITYDGTAYVPMKLSGSRNFTLTFKEGVTINSVTLLAMSNGDAEGTVGAGDGDATSLGTFPARNNVGNCLTIDITGNSGLRGSRQFLALIVVDYTPAPVTDPVIDAVDAITIRTTESGKDTIQTLNVEGANLSGSTLTATLNPAVSGLSVALASSTIADGAITTTATLTYNTTENAKGTTTLTLSDGTTSKAVTVNYAAKVVYSELQPISEATTWDFGTDVTYAGTTDFVSYDQKKDIVYADFDELTFAESFNANALAFQGQFPFRSSSKKFAQNGILHFKTTVPGIIKVKFTDTGSGASADAVKRYLIVNGEQTEYWTSRENNGTDPYAAQLNVETGEIAVPTGDVTISGSSAICVSYIIFTPTPQPEGETVTFDFAANEWEHALGSGTGETADAGNVDELKKDNVTVLFKQAAGSTHTRYWTGPQIRLYSNNIMKVIAPEGKAVTKIEFTASGASYFGLTSAEAIGTLTETAWTGNSTYAKFIATKTNRLTKMVVTLADTDENTIDMAEANEIVNLDFNDPTIHNEFDVVENTYLTEDIVVVDGVRDDNDKIAGENRVTTTIPFIPNATNSQQNYIRYSSNGVSIYLRGGKVIFKTEADKVFSNIKMTTNVFKAKMNGEEVSKDQITGEGWGCASNIVEMEVTGGTNINSITFTIADEYVAPVPPFNPATAITNANFEADEPIASKVCTYAKDVLEGQVANMQPLTGWTIVENGDARAAGTFAYGSTAILGGDGGNVPAVGPNGETEGKALGLEAVWSATTQYTQDITLPAGEYLFEAVIYNAAGTGALATNLIGIDGNYLATKSYPVGKWTKDQVKFTLAEENTVTVSLGVNSGNVGNGAAPHLFIDHVKLYGSEEIAAQELAAAKENALATIDALPIGDALFLYNEAAIQAAKADVNTAETIEAVNTAIAAAHAAQNKPAADKEYVITNKTAQLALSITTEAVKIEKEGAVKFTEVEGGWVLSNTAETPEYIFKTTGNTWTLSTTTTKDEAYKVNFNLVDGAYTIQGANGLFGTDNANEGSAVYANKAQANNGLWTIAEKPEFQPAYGTLWTEEQGSQVDENEFNYITLENKYFKDFAKAGDTIKVAISHVGNQPSSRARIITEGTLNLTIDNAGESKTIQQDMTSADLVLDADEIANIQNGANVVLSWKNMTVAKVDLIEKVEAVKTDYTDYIANADLTDSENKGWDDAGTKGIDGSGIVKASTGATFNFSQTIANLPAGKYKLTAQAAYRYSGNEADEYAAMQTDAITKFAQLYATVGTKNTNALVQNRYDGASDTDLAGEGAVQVNNLWVPNSSNAVKAWFAAGKYVNEVEFNLPADGDVKIGIVKTTSPEAGDYTVIGPWTLTRLGDAEEEPEPETIKPGDDVTKFIVNNSFETGDLTGWTVGSSSDTGVKPNSNGTYTTEGCDGDYLFNTWWQGIPITQTITNLPKGKYELKALMANDAITAGNKPCLYLLANGDHSEAFSSPNAGTFAEGTMEFYVTDGTATIGAIGGNADGSFTEAGYYWYKVDNFRLTFVEALPNIDDIEIPEGKMSNAAAQAIADAKAAGDVVALLEAVKVAKASIEAYAHLNGVLNELTDILEKTNVYTAEAKQTFDTAFNTAQTGYNDGTISDADAKAFNYGSRLEGLLPSLLLSAYTSTVNGTPYINTWSVEGNNDGTNYLTAFFEYWVGDAESLAENTITATMNNVQKGIYDVTAWVRVRIKNGATAPATGIFFQVNDQTGESVVGEQLGNTQFYLKEMATNATVDTDGKLTIKFNVAADNNISWLSFKNVKFAYNESATVGIKNVNNAKNANDTIYNLNGQKVEKAQKGLYIINGKKVVIK